MIWGVNLTSKFNKVSHADVTWARFEAFVRTAHSNQAWRGVDFNAISAKCLDTYYLLNDWGLAYCGFTYCSPMDHPRRSQRGSGSRPFEIAAVVDGHWHEDTRHLTRAHDLKKQFKFQTFNIVIIFAMCYSWCYFDQRQQVWIEPGLPK